MTRENIEITKRTLNDLYEKIRIRDNEEIAKLKQAEIDHGLDFRESISTMQGSLFAHQRKINRIIQLLDKAEQDL